MSRLIDADKLIERIEEITRTDMMKVLVEDWINSQPTAFDVDKVVEKLKHCQNMLLRELKNATSYSHKQELIENIRHYEYAINIVKAGGIDE